MATFEQIAEQINLKGWLVLNCFQFSVGKWRANAQKRSDNGSTLEVFVEYSDGDTPSVALAAVLKTIEDRTKWVGKSAPPLKTAAKGSKNVDEASLLGPAIDMMLAARGYGSGSKGGTSRR